MPFARCKFYTDSGEPVRGGCRRRGAGTCSFVHPGDSNWDSAPPPRTKDMGGGGSGGFKSWDERSGRDAPTPSSATSDVGGGWDTGGGGWNTGGSTSTPNQAPEPVPSKKQSLSNSWNASASANGWNQADTRHDTSGNTKRSESEWGSGVEATTGSGWGNRGSGVSTWGGGSKTAVSGWGSNENDGSSWRTARDSDRSTASGWGSTQSGGWGTNGDDTVRSSKPMDTGKTSGSGWGSTPNSGWGASGGDSNNMVGSGWGSASSGGWGANRRDSSDTNKTADKALGSGWGSASSGGWGTSGRDSSDANEAANKASGSGWGNSQSDGWGTGGGSTGNANKATDKTAGSGRGSTPSGRWGAGSNDANKATVRVAGPGWGSGRWETSGGDFNGADKAADKLAGSTWGSTPSGGWGTSREDSINANQIVDKTAESGLGPTPSGTWGANKDTPSSWGGSTTMITDNRTEKETRQDREKGKLVPVPPRIRTSDSESKKTKITGTNSGNPRSPNHTTSNSAVTSTPVTVSTPTDSVYLKRKRDVASNDQLDVFKGYIKTWERGVRARFLLEEAEAKRNRWFRTQKSLCYTRIGEAGRKKLDGQRAECDKEVNLQREKLSAAITSLMEFHDTISSQLDMGQHYNIGAETQQFIADSKTFVDEIHALIATHILKKDGVQSDDSQKHPSGVDTAFIDSFHSQLQELEERLDQAHTELTLRHERDIRSEIDEHLAKKIAELREARQREIDHVVSQSHQEIVIPAPALQSIEVVAQQVEEADAKIPHTVEDIRVLLNRVDATTKRVSQLEEELTADKKIYEKHVQEMATEKKAMEHKVDERLDKIREQFEQLVASQPLVSAVQTDVILDTVDSRDRLVDSLRPAFEANLDRFYEQEVRPTMESMQQAVIAASNRHHQEAIKMLWGKMQPAMNMVAGVSQWLDSQELGFTAPVEDGS